jgi:hypothetical protein
MVSKILKTAKLTVKYNKIGMIIKNGEKNSFKSDLYTIPI